jgi:FkbM family methyltransferase
MSNDLKSFFSKSKKFKLDYKVVYDIGGHKGEFSKIVKKYYRKSKIYLFEPNTQHNKAMSKYGEVHNITLWKEKGIKDFYSISESGDSLYQEFSLLYKSVIPKQVPVFSLDEYVNDNGLEYPDLIKLDTQGSELDILAGGLECLSKATAIIVECPLVLYNINAPSINDYISTIIGYGYQPIELTEVHYMDGTMVQIDLAFINKNKTRG